MVKMEEIEFCDDALPISKVKIEIDNGQNLNEWKPKNAKDQFKPIKKEENEQNIKLEVKNPNKNIKIEEQNNEKDTTSCSSNYSDYSASSADNSADGEEMDSIC
ncbi:hypothetical protein niasHT_026531 [Heterodera trifolii]|uniref:Uncharacterized protein n=1 Tax=Heterodera trifolii TaxID=157864 RepID=A0ABD2KS94_9BILA